ncbi:FIG00442372: hypothetical protein [hydrothermal vent metagenome]|uniref:Haloacid dehalogenase-like hydrolase n=1 Tax=hydrothermal vent metagenome TaxID=652676 RepID=A0A3B1CCZ0_9ZZZZ
MIIGVDFDNTIATYDDLMYKIALEAGFVAKNIEVNKRAIRNAIRALPGGEKKWRVVQAKAYGPKMKEARLIEGVRTFFMNLKKNRIPVYIISHKTEFADFDDSKTNLRKAALEWMEEKQFFSEKGLGLGMDHVRFGATRIEKIGWIKQLGCTHFIDDLEEVFSEPDFPGAVRKILFSPLCVNTSSSNTEVFSSWAAIYENIIGRPE